MTPQMVRLVGAMLRAPSESWYGLQLTETTGLKSGTIYPALARLERAGWLESSWEDVDPSRAARPRRRLYQLTGLGEIAARRKLDELAAELDRARSPRGDLGGVPGAHPA